MISSLERLYAHAQGAVAFIDETYYAPSNGKGRTFYVTCAAIFQRKSLDFCRDELQEMVGSDYWHTSEAAKSPAGRDKIHEIAAYLNEEMKSVCWLYEPLEPSDRQGERARSKSLKFGVPDLVRRCLPSAGMIVYEQRPSGFQANADVRTMAELRNAGRLDREFLVHPESPAYEPLLWAPDLIGWAYRQDFLGKSADYFEKLKETTEVVRVK